MEPLTCAIERDGNGGVVLHEGAQFPTFGHLTLNQVLILPMEKVRVRTLQADGSFGHRADPTADCSLKCVMGPSR